MIIDRAYNSTNKKYGRGFNEATLEQVAIVIYFMAVKLPNGYSGLGYPNLNSLECCSQKRTKCFSDFTPGNIRGREVAGLFIQCVQPFIIKTVELVPTGYKKHLFPIHLSEKAVSTPEIISISASSLSNNRLADLLGFILSGIQVIVVDPTRSLIPDVLFAYWVKIPGATWIIISDKMLRLVAERASRFQLFKSCAPKIRIANES